MCSGKPVDLTTPFKLKFPDESSCRKWLCTLACTGICYCPGCRRSKFKADFNEMKLFCPRCGKTHSILRKTIFESSRLPLRTILLMTWLITHNEKGLTTKEMMNLTGIGSYRTCWIWMNKIRAALNFFPVEEKWNAVEADNFSFSVKSRSEDGSIISKVVKVTVLIGRNDYSSKLMKMAVTPLVHKYEINQMIRDLLQGAGVIFVPDRSWFYSDERGLYRVRLGEKSKMAAPLCRLNLPNGYAKGWMHWSRKYYGNNILEANLQGYLNAFVFYTHRPRYPEAGNQFDWIVSNLLKQETAKKGQGRHPVPRNQPI